MRRCYWSLIGTLLILGCAPTAQWPVRGAYFCQTSNAQLPAVVVAQDGVGRTLRVGLPVQPGERTCFRWPFVDARGRTGLVVGRDTTWGAWFNPWQVDR